MQGAKANSYMAGGGVIFGLFIVYVIFFGVKWYCGAGQREVLKREAVEKQIAKERALQALQNIEWLYRFQKNSTVQGYGMAFSKISFNHHPVYSWDFQLMQFNMEVDADA